MKKVYSVLPIVIIASITTAAIIVPPVLCYILAGVIDDGVTLEFVRASIVRSALGEGIIVALGFLGLCIALAGRGRQISALKDELADLAAKKDLLETEKETLRAEAAKNEEALSELRVLREGESALLAELRENTGAVSEQWAGVEEALRECLAGLEEPERIPLDLFEPPKEAPREKSAGTSFQTRALTEELAGNVKNVEALQQKLSDGEAKAGEANRIIIDIAADVEKITGLAGVISQISSQTNMLSMNAAIESAHAGPAGAGFAVVAEEIKKLAESTSVNAKEIQIQIRGISEKTRAGLLAGDLSSRAIREIGGTLSEFENTLPGLVSRLSGMPREEAAESRSYAGIDRDQLEKRLIELNAGMKARQEQIRSALDRVRIRIEEINPKPAAEDRPPLQEKATEHNSRGVAVKEGPKTVL
jgi:methyl-accepting chemotaxis protein